jgi:hypothetical protein
MAEYSKLASGTFTTSATPVAQYVNLPFQPQTVKLYNVTASSTPAQNSVTEAFWDINMGQGTALISYTSAASSPWVSSNDYVSTGGINTFSAGRALIYGPQIQIASIAKANPTVVTTASAHGLSIGQVVILEGLFQSSTTGMPQMSLMPFVITAVGSPTTFTILWNSNQSNYTALTGSPTGAFVRQVLFPWLYLPGDNFINAMLFTGAATSGSTFFPTSPANVPAGQTWISTTGNHNYVVGQQVGFRIPAAYGTTQLNELPNNLIPGSPVYYYVTQILSNTSFAVALNSTGFTAFNTNETVAQMVGQSLPQVVAAGDINSGGTPYSGGALYPSPSFPTFSGGVPTINGPAISGAFVNNTSQGFVVGLGAGTVATSALLLTASSQYIWEAFYFDYGS